MSSTSYKFIKHKSFLRVIYAFILIVFTFQFYAWTQTEVLNFSEESAPANILRIDYDIWVPIAGSKKLSVRAEECLESLIINGVAVNWKRILYLSRLCKYDGAKVLELKELQPGLNKVSLSVSKGSGPQGATLRVAQSSAPYILFYTYLGLLFVSLAFLSWQKLFKSRWESWLMSCWVLFAYIYALRTPWDTRGYDAFEHLEYIRYYMMTNQLPDIRSCWQCFQAPGYYMFSNYFLKALEIFFGSSDFRIVLLQLTSLFCLYVFFLGLRKIWEIWGRFHTPHYLVFFFIMSTPTTLLYAARLGNDPLFYVAAIFVLFYSLQFWKKLDGKNFIVPLQYTFAWLAGALFIKATAILLVAYVGILLLLALGQFPRKKFLTVEFVGTCGLGSVIVFISYFYRPLFRGESWRAFRINTLDDGLKISQQLYHFLVIEPSSFFRHPMVKPFGPSSGREFFWNYLLKSFSFGEFNIDNLLNFRLALVRNALTLILGAAALFYWVRAFRRSPTPLRLPELPLLLLPLVLIGGHMLYRLYHPYSSSGDARLIYPVLVFFSSLMWARHRAISSLLVLATGVSIIFWLNFFITGVY